MTDAVVLDGNVLVAGFTYSIYAKSGNPGGASKLANSGSAHLGELSRCATFGSPRTSSVPPRLTGATGLEPATSGFGDRCSTN